MPKPSKKVLITGGAGFIGYHLARHLAENGQRVVICDNFFRDKLRCGVPDSKISSDDFERYADPDLRELAKRKNVKFILCDLSDGSQLQKLGRNYDQVYHLAAVNGTRFFYEYPHEVLRIDVSTTLNILDWFIKSGSKKILFASTCETYAGYLEAFGKMPLPTKENIPLVVSDPLNPRWSYGGSKIVGELFFVNYAKKYNFDMVIARYHNLFGPREGWEHVVPQFITRVIARQDPFLIYGAKNKRSFCYIDDGVRATELIMESKKTNGEIIHVGRGDNEIAMLDLAKKMFNLFGFYPKKIKIFPAPEGSAERRQPDTAKLKRLVGFTPKVSLEQGLRRTHTWYLEHQNPCPKTQN